MTTEQHATLTAYIRLIADGLGLKDWTFNLKYEAAEEGTLAETKDSQGRKFAYIRMGTEFWDASPETQRSTIVHECLHWRLASADDVVYYDLSSFGWMKSQHVLGIYNTYKRQREYAIDGIAEAIAVHYPLIQWDNHEPDTGEQLHLSSSEAGAAGEVRGDQGEGEGIRRTDRESLPE